MAPTDRHTGMLIGHLWRGFVKVRLDAGGIELLCSIDGNLQTRGGLRVILGDAVKVQILDEHHGRIVELVDAKT